MRIDVRLPPVLGGGALRVLRRRVRRRRGRLRPFGRPRRRRRKGREGGADRGGVGDPPRPPPPGPGGKAHPGPALPYRRAVRGAAGKLGRAPWRASVGRQVKRSAIARPLKKPLKK